MAQHKPTSVRLPPKLLADLQLIADSDGYHAAHWHIVQAVEEYVKRHRSPGAPRRRRRQEGDHASTGTESGAESEESRTQVARPKITDLEISTLADTTDEINPPRS